MDRGRHPRDNLFGFGDPFTGFFGGRDPFDDPFFTQPFGPMIRPTLFGQSMFGPRGNLFGDSSFSLFPEPQPKRLRGPIIEELPSDEEEQGENQRNRNNLVKDEEKDRSVASSSNPRTHSYNFHSSTVTYGGPGGAYYTSSTTRRTGGDGVTVEESREADTTSRKATHRISRGIREKGHSVTRKLDSDGRVDTVQTLHNINEDELPGFEKAWMNDARRHLPGWEPGFMLNDGSAGGHSASRQRALPALPPRASSRPGSSSTVRR